MRKEDGARGGGTRPAEKRSRMGSATRLSGPRAPNNDKIKGTRRTSKKETSTYAASPRRRRTTVLAFLGAIFFLFTFCVSLRMAGSASRKVHEEIRIAILKAPALAASFEVANENFARACGLPPIERLRSW